MKDSCVDRAALFTKRLKTALKTGLTVRPYMHEGPYATYDPEDFLRELLGSFQVFCEIYELFRVKLNEELSVPAKVRGGPEVLANRVAEVEVLSKLAPAWAAAMGDGGPSELSECPTCHGRFDPWVASRRATYCSNACRQKAYRQRQASV